MSMNPLNLLTKGHAIRGTKEGGYYKLLTKNPLPNFSGNKGVKANPTTSHVIRKASQPALFEQAKPAHVPAPALPKPEPVAKPEPKTMHAVRAIPAAPAPLERPTASTATKVFSPVAETEAKPNPWSKWAEAAAGWMRQLAPGRKPSPAPTTAVQTELALEKVKVMRNDLADDDLEVVAVKAKAQAKPLREIKAASPMEQPQQQATAQP